MSQNLEARMRIMEEKQKSIDDLVQLLEDVKRALRIFVRLGNVIKWLAAVVLSCSGIAWAYKHFGSGI